MSAIKAKEYTLTVRVEDEAFESEALTSVSMCAKHGDSVIVAEYDLEADKELFIVMDDGHRITLPLDLVESLIEAYNKGSRIII